MRTDAGSTDIDIDLDVRDIEYSDDEPTRRFTGPNVGDMGQTDGAASEDQSATSRGHMRSDVHKTPVGGVPALVRMTADEDAPPLGTIIRCHAAATSSNHTAASGVGSRFGRQSHPRGTENRGTRRANDDSRAHLTARMRRVGDGLEMRLRDEAERSDRTRVALLIAIGVVLGMFVVSMLWPGP